MNTQVNFDPPRPNLAWHLGPNDGGLKRGDREDTGDNQAAPDEMGSGDAQPTADPTSMGGTSGFTHRESSHFDATDELNDVDGMEVMVPSDGRLGLTDVEGVPADDWAADTGPEHSAEEGLDS